MIPLCLCDLNVGELFVGVHLEVGWGGAERNGTAPEIVESLRSTDHARIEILKEILNLIKN